LALAAGALLMLALIFGTALLQRWDTLTQQMVYSLIYAALIATLSWDRWSVDALRSGRRCAGA
jgi:thiosulfate dehydrogenase [quinone] large subunit